MLEIPFDLKNKKITAVMTILILGTIIVRLLTKDIPNVEPIMATTIAGSIIFGPLGGFTIGMISMLISGLLIPPLGIHIVYTTLSFGFIGLISGYWKRFIHKFKLYHIPIVAISLTILYDILTNIGFAFQFGMPVWEAEIAGIPFMILHALSNFAICSLVVPIILKVVMNEMIKIPTLKAQFEKEIEARVRRVIKR
jgi:LytS/YehU family sensor histidine kinase